MPELTIQAVWLAARDRLAAVSDSAALDAQLLLTDVLGYPDRAYLFTHPERTLTAEQAAHYAALIQRRADGEPVAYLRGFRDWYDRQIIVTPAVLIPRPETELLLEMALAYARPLSALTAADIGTGSGALAVTFAAHTPQAAVYAVDISAAALDVARRNTEAANVRVTLLQGDLLAPLIAQGIKLDLLLANLPYIASDAVPPLEVARHEPILALDGGADGLTLIRRLLADAPQVCQPHALILLEIGMDQGAAVLALVDELLPHAHADIVPDYSGRDRFARVTL
jgi:release factor glutamine methyltransferase